MPASYAQIIAFVNGSGLLNANKIRLLDYSSLFNTFDPPKIENLPARPVALAGSLRAILFLVTITSDE